jgi:hypothetical protein
MRKYNPDSVPLVHEGHVKPHDTYQDPVAAEEYMKGLSDAGGEQNTPVENEVKPSPSEEISKELMEVERLTKGDKGFPAGIEDSNDQLRMQLEERERVSAEKDARLLAETEARLRETESEERSAPKETKVTLASPDYAPYRTGPSTADSGMELGGAKTGTFNTKSNKAKSERTATATINHAGEKHPPAAEDFAKRDFDPKKDTPERKAAAEKLVHERAEKREAKRKAQEELDKKMKEAERLAREEGMKEGVRRAKEEARLEAERKAREDAAAEAARVAAAATVSESPIPTAGPTRSAAEILGHVNPADRPEGPVATPRHATPESAAAIPPNTPPTTGASERGRARVGRGPWYRRAASAVGGAAASPFRWLGRGAKWAGGEVKFAKDRADSKIFMGFRNWRTNAAAAKFEGAKAQFDEAKGYTDGVQKRIRELDEQKEQDKDLMTPKDVKRMEKERQKLQNELVKAQEKQDHALNDVKHRESITMNHENKRTEIAKHYAELVDNRLRPLSEHREKLEGQKADYKAEIQEWNNKIAGYEQRIAGLEATAKRNPYAKKRCAEQVKALRKTLAKSKASAAEKAKKINNIDNPRAPWLHGLISADATLQKWKTKKDAYANFANRKITQFQGGHFIGGPDANDIEQRDPAPARPREHRGVTAARAEGSSAREAAIESAPTTYGVGEWVREWNLLHRSGVRLEAAALVRRGSGRDGSPVEMRMNAAQFTRAVQAFIVRPEVVEALGPKVKPRQVAKLVRETLESLQSKVAEAELRGDITDSGETLTSEVASA